MPETPHYIGHRKRLKEKFASQGSGFLDYELLELLLGYALPRRDTKPLAKELLFKFGNLKGVFNAKRSEIEKLPGAGPGLNLFFEILREYLYRMEKEEVLHKEKISHPEEIVSLARRRIGYSGKESFWMVLLDNKNRVLDFKQMSKGTVDQANIYPREIFGEILENKASGVILVHNHPGGDPQPSIQDKQLTSKIQNTAQNLGIRVLDHIIVAEDKYFSFQGQGLV